MEIKADKTSQELNNLSLKISSMSFNKKFF